MAKTPRRCKGSPRNATESPPPKILSPRTVGRILALNREIYRLEKPKGPTKEK